MGDLTKKYRSIRRTRPDGNCFFRAFCYAYLERLIKNKNEFKEFTDRVQVKHKDLIQMGFPQFTVDDFYDTVTDVVVTLCHLLITCVFSVHGCGE